MLTPQEKHDINGALVAWTSAIQSKIQRNNPEESYDDLAKQFGSRITTSAALEEVSNWFDWDRIVERLK